MQPIPLHCLVSMLVAGAIASNFQLHHACFRRPIALVDSAALTAGMHTWLNCASVAGYEDVEHLRAHRGGLDGEALLE